MEGVNVNQTTQSFCGLTTEKDRTTPQIIIQNELIKNYVSFREPTGEHVCTYISTISGNYVFLRYAHNDWRECMLHCFDTSKFAETHFGININGCSRLTVTRVSNLNHQSWYSVTIESPDEVQKISSVGEHNIAIKLAFVDL